MVLNDEQLKLLEAFFDENTDGYAKVGQKGDDGRSVSVLKPAMIKKTFLNTVQSFCMNLPNKD